MSTHRRTRIKLVAVAAAAASLVGGGVAWATAPGDAQVDPTLATFTFRSTHEKQRICSGEDGPYIEIRAHHEGTQVGDPRLSGVVDLEAHNFISLATGLGTSEGTFTIRDPATNKLKVSGKYYGVFTEGSKFHGFEIATVKAEGAGPNEELVGDGELRAVVKAEVNFATGEVAGQLGGASPDPRTPAVIRRGYCTGPYTQVP